MNADDKDEILTQTRIALSKLETAIEKDIASLSREMNIRFAQEDRALTLQAAEYERRLAMLNHESEQLKAMQATYVPRETYEGLEDDVEALTLYKERQQGEKSWAVIISLIAALIAGASLIVNVIG